MNMGGICIGCTMPGFPDKFAPFYATPPGAYLSSTASKTVGGFIRRFRALSMRDKQVSPRWEQDRDLASGWARYRTQPRGAEKVAHHFYERIQARTKA